MSAHLADDVSPARFENLFRADADPWGTRTRWYEQRKRALTLAALPCARYARAFEPGCGAGELTAELALRCDTLVASDASAAAAAHARERVAASAHVRVDHGAVPAAWPEGRFDLVVISELGYYLDPAALARLMAACRESLTGDATLLACHWRHGAGDMRQGAADVHAAIDACCGRRRLSRYEDGDFLLDVWCGDGRSVARREGLA